MCWARAASGASCRWAASHRSPAAWLAGVATRAPAEGALLIGRASKRMTAARGVEALASTCKCTSLAAPVHPHDASPFLRQPCAAVQQRPARRAGVAGSRQHRLPPRSPPGSTSSIWLRPTTPPIRGRTSSRNGARRPRQSSHEELRLRPARSARSCGATPGYSKAAIARAAADAGETVRVEADDGRFLAWAAYSPRLDDPRAGLELRRGRAHRRRLLRAPRRAAVALAPGFVRQRRRAASCTARPTACRA